MARLLLRGITGLDVSELQAALNFHIRKPAEPLKPDGIFGPLTDARVREFQRRANILVDGKVGPGTIAALYRTVQGAVEINVTPRKASAAQSFARGQVLVGSGQRSALPTFPGLRQIGPTVPDFVPPSQKVPQARTATSQGFEVESKVLFNPVADSNDGEHPLRLTLSPTLPWPVFLPAPLKLDVELTTPGVGKFQLDGKFKLPFKLVDSRRFELKPYFFVGAGVNQDNYKELNAGAGSSVKVKLLEIGKAVRISVEADGGIKFNHDRASGEGKVKGFLEGGFVLEFPF